MIFEHIITVNDVSEPIVTPMSRWQLWQGLMRRVTDPVRFSDTLDEARVTEVTTTHWTRELHYGPLVVRDRVTADPMDSIRYEVEWPPRLAGSRMTMRIEEPAFGTMIVRFVYDSPYASADPQVTRAQRTALESAYLHADIDAIALVRRMVSSGEIE
jgi:hypothetical protein